MISASNSPTPSPLPPNPVKADRQLCLAVRDAFPTLDQFLPVAELPKVYLSVAEAIHYEVKAGAASCAINREFILENFVLEVLPNSLAIYAKTSGGPVPIFTRNRHLLGISILKDPLLGVGPELAAALQGIPIDTETRDEILTFAKTNPIILRMGKIRILIDSAPIEYRLSDDYDNSIVDDLAWVSSFSQALLLLEKTKAFDDSPHSQHLRFALILHTIGYFEQVTGEVPLGAQVVVDEVTSLLRNENLIRFSTTLELKLSEIKNDPTAIIAALIFGAQEVAKRPRDAEEADVPKLTYEDFMKNRGTLLQIRGLSLPDNNENPIIGSTLAISDPLPVILTQLRRLELRPRLFREIFETLRPLNSEAYPRDFIYSLHQYDCLAFRSKSEEWIQNQILREALFVIYFDEYGFCRSYEFQNVLADKAERFLAECIKGYPSLNEKLQAPRLIAHAEACLRAAFEVDHAIEQSSTDILIGRPDPDDIEKIFRVHRDFMLRIEARDFEGGQAVVKRTLSTASSSSFPIDPESVSDFLEPLIKFPPNIPIDWERVEELLSGTMLPFEARFITQQNERFHFKDPLHEISFEHSDSAQLSPESILLPPMSDYILASPFRGSSLGTASHSPTIGDVLIALSHKEVCHLLSISTAALRDELQEEYNDSASLRDKFAAQGLSMKETALLSTVLTLDGTHNSIETLVNYFFELRDYLIRRLSKEERLSFLKTLDHQKRVISIHGLHPFNDRLRAKLREEEFNILSGWSSSGITEISDIEDIT